MTSHSYKLQLLFCMPQNQKNINSYHVGLDLHGVYSNKNHLSLYWNQTEVVICVTVGIMQNQSNDIRILMQNRRLHISGLLAILLTTTMVHTQTEVGYDSDTINATVITIDCLSKTITFQSGYISLSPQRFGFKMSFSILKSRSSAALEAAAWREILKEGSAH